jgi:molybdate/tungstate transport system substrate-binding protein
MLSAQILPSSAVSRRGFLSAAAAAGLLLGPAVAAQIVEVAYAGSMAPLMEGGLKAAAGRALGLDLHGRAQGASALAELIAGGSLRPDVFLSVTPGPMETVLASGHADRALPIAHTEMVIAYSPRGRFASDFARAAAGGTPPWWEILQRPGCRFGRSDPAADPQGRNIIFVFRLAEQVYRQPGLAARVLGPVQNPRQIFAETMLEARLQSGQLDAAAAYRVQPGAFQIPYLRLPPAINLGGPLPAAANALRLDLSGHSYRPQPLVYYAAVLQPAPHPQAAARLVAWLQAPEAQQILRRAAYDPPGDAAPLRRAPAPGSA